MLDNLTIERSVGYFELTFITYTSEMSPPHHKSGRDVYGRDILDPRDSRSTVQYSDSGSRTPVGTTTDPRAAMDSTISRDPRDTVYGRDPRAAVESIVPRDLRDTAYERDTRTPPPGATRVPRDLLAYDSRDSISVRLPVDRRDVRDPRSVLDPSRSRDPANYGRASDYFLPAEDINREVITTDICKYLGPDALVRPYVHRDVSFYPFQFGHS